MRPPEKPFIPRRRALPTNHLRAAAAGLAAMQGVLGTGVWLFAPPDARAWVVMVVNTAVSAGALAIFLHALWRAGPVARREPAAVLAMGLVQAAACPAAVLVARADPGDPWAAAGPAVFIVGTGVMLVLAAAPVLAGLAKRTGVGDDGWSAHEANAAARTLAIVWATVLFGAWTASVGIGANAVVIALRMQGQTLEPRLTVALMAVSHALGMAAGLAGAGLTVPLLRRTHLRRSIPRVFLPTMAAGVVGCAIFPPLGILVSGVTMGLGALLARRRWPLIPPGHCQSCAYDLTGASAPVCPECGAPVADTRPA